MCVCVCCCRCVPGVVLRKSCHLRPQMSKPQGPLIRVRILPMLAWLAIVAPGCVGAITDTAHSCLPYHRISSNSSQDTDNLRSGQVAIAKAQLDKLRGVCAQPEVHALFIRWTIHNWGKRFV